MEENTEIKITWEEVKELIPKRVSLHYVDYRDSLDEKTQLLEKCIKEGSDQSLQEESFDWYIDDHYAMDEIFKDLQSSIESKFDVEDASDIIEQFHDEIQETVWDRDDSNVVKDLLRNTSKQTMFYDTGYEVESESWSWTGLRVKKEIKAIKKHLKLKGEVWDNALDMMIRQASYGGQLVIYFYESVEQFFNTEKIKTISFKNFHVAIINTGNGSGNDTHLPGALTELPFTSDNLYLCKNIGYSYTFSVCGMSSDWCSDTDVALLEAPIKYARKPKETALAKTQARDKAFEVIFKSGKCSLGDMNYGRHRNTTYINNFPCGNKCLDCGTFWID